MAEPIVGVVIRRLDNEPRPAATADLSVVGVIGPAPAADPEMFPFNVPVKLYSNDYVKLAKIGDQGFILDAIRGVNDQLGDLQRAAEVVFVRTPEGTNANAALKTQETIANIMGSSVAGTGMWAFTLAPELIGETPRLITAPGYTGQLANGVETLTVATAGSGYVPNSEVPITFTGGGTAATIVQATGVALIGADGSVAGVRLDSRGQWYTAPPTATVPAPAGGGTQATFTVTLNAVGNPIVSGSGAVLSQLLAHGLFESSGITEQGDKDWRETINMGRVIPLVGGVKVIDPATGAVVVRPVAGRVAGLFVRRDFEKGAPFHSVMNQPIQGIVGAARHIRFSITDGANEGQSLLEANLGIVVKGEVGSDFAIASGGYVFVGTDNAGEDELWRFYNVTRGRDYIHLVMIRMLRFYLGRFNITGQTVRAILNGMGAILRDLQADEHILGYRVYFTGSQNSAEEIRKGNITVSFAAEEPPVLRKITTESARYRPAIDAMVAQLEAQLNIAA